MTFEFEAIGTHWKIQIEDEISDSKRSDIFNSVMNRIAEYDKNYSRFRADSLVTEMSQKNGVYTLPEDARPLFDLYQRLYYLTEGAVTPLIGNLLEEAGYDANYTFETKELHVPPKWDDAILYQFPTLEIKKPVLIDVGAAGKGYLIDIVGELLSGMGIRSFSINAGGDILHVDKSNTSIRVGLEQPGDATKVIGVATVGNESICGSAGSRRTWGKFHHILNPHTLQSQRTVLAVWVIAKSALLADALTTCLFFVEPERMNAAFEFEYVIMYPDFSVVTSKNFQGELFLS